MIESRRSDPYDAKPVIQYAYEKARKLDKPTYVEVSKLNYKFIYTDKQPKVCWSHWKCMPDGEVFAHLAEQGLTEYKYEKVGA